MPWGDSAASSLLNGTRRKGGVPGWAVADGVFASKPGAGGIGTQREFADGQLHREWRPAAEGTGEGEDRGHSGVYLRGRYEGQVLDRLQNFGWLSSAPARSTRR